MSAPTLLVIDVQAGFDDPGWGPRNNPEAEERISELLRSWRRAVAPIIHVRHHSVTPGGRFVGGGMAFKRQAAPLSDEPVVTKEVNSAFIGTDLEQRLRTAGADTVVVAGLTTDHCCSTTARMAANLGFDVWFLSDATATFDRLGPNGKHLPARTMHEVSLASLHGEFAEIIDTAEAVRRLEDDRQPRPDPTVLT